MKNANPRLLLFLLWP